MKAQHAYDAALYCRFSRDDNNGSAESMSISNQRQLLGILCEGKRLEYR